MTASLEEIQIQNIPHLVKAVILLVVTTIVLFIWLALPHRKVEAGGTQVSIETAAPHDLEAGASREKISAFGPIRRGR